MRENRPEEMGWGWGFMEEGEHSCAGQESPVDGANSLRRACGGSKAERDQHGGARQAGPGASAAGP